MKSETKTLNFLHIHPFTWYRVNDETWNLESPNDPYLTRYSIRRFGPDPRLGLVDWKLVATVPFSSIAEKIVISPHSQATAELAMKAAVRYLYGEFQARIPGFINELALRKLTIEQFKKELEAPAPEPVMRPDYENFPIVTTTHSNGSAMADISVLSSDGVVALNIHFKNYEDAEIIQTMLRSCADGVS